MTDATLVTEHAELRDVDTAVTGRHLPALNGLRGVAVIGVVLAFFAVDTIRNDPWSFVAIVAITIVAVVLDALFRRPPPDAAVAAAPR